MTPMSPPAADRSASIRTRVPSIRPDASATAKFHRHSNVPSHGLASSAYPSGVGYWKGACPMRVRYAVSWSPASVFAAVARNADAMNSKGRLSFAPRDVVSPYEKRKDPKTGEKVPVTPLEPCKFSLPNCAGR